MGLCARLRPLSASPSPSASVRVLQLQEMLCGFCYSGLVYIPMEVSAQHFLYHVGVGCMQTTLGPETGWALALRELQDPAATAGAEC